jgi:L-lactate dehydrogenase (cytochrome)
MLKQAGKDGTRAFKAVHSKSILSHLPPESLLGQLDPTEVQSLSITGAKDSTETVNRDNLILAHMLNLNDFERAASKSMDSQGYGYYASAANDEVTKRDNCAAFSRAWLKPRVMRNVSSINTRCTLLGTEFAFPVFISPAAMAGLAHEDAEPALARAAGKLGALHVVANMASRELEEITDARLPGQTQWYQIYVNPERSKTEAIIKRAVQAGVKALLVTVDTPQLGRRERDMRNKVTDSSNISLVQKDGITDTSAGVAQALGDISDARLNWDDLAWIRKITDLPIILKGVQSGEDAVLAAQHGCAGVLVSNHGGRQLDHARPTFEILVEVMQDLEEAQLKDKIEVYLDGGVRRGTDVYKALALGAKAVGIGRPCMYALTFGQDGVEKCLQLIRDEFMLTMKLMGVTSIDQIRKKDIVLKAFGGTLFNDGWPVPSRL